MGMFDEGGVTAPVTEPAPVTTAEPVQPTETPPKQKRTTTRKKPVSSLKPSNPKDSVGIKKVPMSCVPATVIAELGVAMLEGALKYGRHNYRAVGVRASVYYDAEQRHMKAFWEGEDIDPESRLSHITKAIATLTVLRDSMIRGNWVDDRPPKVKAGWLADLNKRAAELVEQYPEPKAAFTELKLP